MSRHGWVIQVDSIRSLRHQIGKLPPTAKRKDRATKPKRRSRKKRR